IKEKTMYGRQVIGIERSTFLIGPTHRIVEAWRQVKVPGHAEEVLNKLKAHAEQ
ncbi:MAG TPA: peroxiredoxin, partial [Xylella fastidiosa subsp. pauca]